MKNFPDTVELSEQEINDIRVNVSGRLTEIRKMLFLSQIEFGDKTGISRIRLSSIEHGHDLLTWSQVLSVTLLCMFNRQTAQYMFRTRMLPQRFFQFIQCKYENEPADYFWRDSINGL